MQWRGYRWADECASQRWGGVLVGVLVAEAVDSEGEDGVLFVAESELFRQTTSAEFPAEFHPGGLESPMAPEAGVSSPSVVIMLTPFLAVAVTTPSSTVAANTKHPPTYIPARICTCTIPLRKQSLAKHGKTPATKQAHLAGIAAFIPAKAGPQSSAPGPEFRSFITSVADSLTPFRDIITSRAQLTKHPTASAA